MPIFIQFDDRGLQQAVMNCQQSPGSDWVQAPANFGWDKTYQLVDGKVVEVTAAEIEATRLKEAKEEAIATIPNRLITVLEQTPGFSGIEREAKTALGRLAQEHPDELTSLVGLLGKTLDEVIARCQSDALAVDKTLLALHVATHTAPAQLEACESLEALEDTKAALEEAFSEQIQNIRRPR